MPGHGIEHKPTSTRNTTSKEDRRGGGEEWKEVGNGHGSKVIYGGDVICGMVVVLVVLVVLVLVVVVVLTLSLPCKA